MSYFLTIFSENIVPIFIQILLGYFLHKKFKFQIGTLTKIQLYVLVPALLFTKVSQAELSGDIVGRVFLYGILIFLCLFIVSSIVAKLLKYPKTLANAFINSVCFYNSGNFCLPLLELLYKGDPFATSVQIIILMTQNITTNTVGIFNSCRGKNGAKKAVMSVLKMPMPYVLVSAILFKLLSNTQAWSSIEPFWRPVGSAISMLSQGMIPMALFTLGVQLANTKISFKVPKVYLSNFLRLVGGPVMAYLLTLLLGIRNMDNGSLIAQVMVISSAAPTAVNTVIIAVEFDNEPEFASQAVFSATALCSITVTMVIFLVTKFI